MPDASWTMPFVCVVLAISQVLVMRGAFTLVKDYLRILGDRVSTLAVEVNTGMSVISSDLNGLKSAARGCALAAKAAAEKAIEDSRHDGETQH